MSLRQAVVATQAEGSREGIAVTGSPKDLLIQYLPSLVHSSHHRSDDQRNQFLSQFRSLLGELGKGRYVPTGLQVKLNPDWFLSAPPQPTLADFHQLFAVVFVDPSGRLNLCADVTASTYNQVPTSPLPSGSSMSQLRLLLCLGQNLRNSCPKK